ncbi:MAG TPA: hypothetical protein VLB01_00880 [Thermodesulfobacteriota bacterium]|nr:hypothetical protein [Thermodesulfobacteriota bacterium]
MPEKNSFSEWLRKNAEKYLLEAATDEMANLYPSSCAKPYREKGVIPFFWRKIFVPIYSRVPWDIRRKIILFSAYPTGKRPHWKRYD